MIAALAAAGAGVLGLLYRSYFATLRVEGLLADGSKVLPGDYVFGREIYALSERDALALAGIGTYAPMTALVTLSRDGDWAAALLEKIGFRSVRGSSLGGGAKAVAEMVRDLRGSETPAAIVVDGPLGPVGRAKPGIVVFGMRTHRPIRALGAAARREIVFQKSWSRIYLPLPFTRVVIACDDPLEGPADPGRGGVAASAEELTRRLALVRRRALAAVGRGERRGAAGASAGEPPDPAEPAGDGLRPADEARER
jgi:hypothetical protein